MTEGVVLENAESPREELLRVLSKENNGEKGSKIKPRLTFLFPISERRRKAVEGIKSGEIDRENLADLLQSDDVVEFEAGCRILSGEKLSEDDREKFLPVFENVSKTKKMTFDEEEIVASAIGQLGEKVLPEINNWITNGEGDIQIIAILAMGRLKEKALPYLSTLSDNRSAWYIRYRAIEQIRYCGEGAIPVLEKLIAEGSKWEKKEAVSSLGFLGEKALHLVKELCKYEDSIVMAEAAKALGNMGKEAFPVLVDLSRDPDPDVRSSALESLGNFGVEALPIIKEYIRDPDPLVKRSIIVASGKIRGPALEILYNFALNDEAFRYDAFWELGGIGEEALPYLKSLAGEEPKEISKLAFEQLGKYGVEVLPFFVKNIKHKEPLIRQIIARNLSDIGEDALPALGIMTKDEDPVVSFIAKESIKRIKSIEKVKGGYSEQLLTNKPLFATSETDLVVDKIRKIEDVARLLKAKFGDRFVGITVFGSIAKGYMNDLSDLDYAIVAEDETILKEFQKHAKSLNLCIEHYSEVKDSNYLQGDIAPLFYGLFFGDHERLSRIQLTTLEKTSDEEWDKIRMNIFINETNIDKAKKRFGLSDEEERKIKETAALLRVPPTRSESIRVLKKRLRIKD